MIPSRDPPTLTEKSNWSDMMHDFVSCCLTKNPNNRLSAVLLLQVFVVFCTEYLDIFSTRSF